MVQLWYTGTMVHWYSGMLVQWYTSTVVHNIIVVQWYTSTLAIQHVIHYTNFWHQRLDMNNVRVATE